MTRFLTCVFLLAFLQPAVAQRKINRSTKAPLYIYTAKVTGGKFDMGVKEEVKVQSDYDDRKKEASDRVPLHTVTLKDYYIGLYEVTQEQWKTIMGSNPSIYDCDQCPVTNVSWPEVQDFIEKLNSTTGKHYRLPTEAEWEYAARGGNNESLIKDSKEIGGVNAFVTNEEYRRTRDKYTTGKQYAGKRLPQDVAWFERNSNYHPHPIGRKKPNELGIYDMSGNVEEWCSDWYIGNYGTKNPVENPKGPDHGNARVVRGGAWNSTADEITVTRRAAYLPDTKNRSLGFRLVEDK